MHILIMKRNVKIIHAFREIHWLLIVKTNVLRIIMNYGYNFEYNMIPPVSLIVLMSSLLREWLSPNN